jgi:eukaryotic-like serine/threonine-protein kinase
MSQAHADRNLLFGILAVQMDFITRDQLIGAMNAWVLEKGKPLGAILQAQGVLAKDEHALLEALVAKHLQKHGNDAARSLAAVGSAASVRDALAKVPDPEVHASLGHVPTQPGPTDMYATRAISIGASTSGGQRFRILRPHARGGLGEVYVARDEELNREVALKEIQNGIADHPESRGRFILEAEITGALEHPGIVPVYGLGAYADGRPFYAMRFVRGDSLQEAITRFHATEKVGRDPGERALALRGLLRRFIDVCHAIAYAHSRGVLHRDLKPGNIMLGQYGETLVVDWGLAKPMDSVAELTPSTEAPIKPASLAGSAPTHLGRAVGTPQYMSPEQAAGRLDLLGPASDVYSLGSTLYCLLTGRAPVDGPDSGAILNRVQRGDFPPPREVKPGVPRALDAICRKAMALRPEERYRAPKDLADDVERWLADEPTRAWPEPWSVRARRWIGRHRVGVTAAAAAVLVAAVSLGVATVLLTAANERERQAKREAQANFQLARQAVDRYHTEVSEDVLLNEPGMEPLRKKLLEAAREFYDKFVEQRRDDPGVRAELGKSLFRLAQITGDIDSPRKAIELDEQALAIFTPLAAEHSEDAEVLSDQAACHHHLGRLQREVDQFAAARQSYESALALWGKLRDAHPTEERYRAEEARSLLGLGNVEQVLRRLDRARDCYEKALATRAELATAHPSAPEYERDLAITRHNLALVQAAAGPADKAQANYQQALTAQEKLAQAYPNVSQYQADAARTHYNFGDLYRQRGQAEQAAAAYQESADRWGRLVDKHPTVARFRAGQGKAYAGLCLARRALRQDGSAEEACAKSQELYQTLADDGSGTPADRAELAAGQRLLGDLQRTAGRPDGAREAYEKALAIQEPLTRGSSALPEYEAGMARILNNLGLLEREQKRAEQADSAFRKALVLWEKLASASPENIDYAAGLCVTRRNLGDLAGEGGRAVAAVELYTQAVAALEAPTAGRGESAEATAALRNAHWRRAESLAGLGRHSEALPDWDRAVDLADGPDKLWGRLHRAVAIARVGDYARAAVEAEALAPLASTTGEALYELACAFALSADAAAHDPKLPTADQRRLAEEYAGKALELLQKSAATGYFKQPGNRDKLKKPDWEVLRARPEFLKLLDA